MFYQKEPYFTGDKIKILKPKYKRFGKENAQFFLAAMRKSFRKFSWGTSSYNVNVIQSQEITLPILSTGEIDFDFMELFIRELEEERIRELAAYLKASGLADYKLSATEETALLQFNDLKWQEYNITDVFTVKNTHNILSSEIVENSGKKPYLCASAENNGVSSYISYNENLLEKGKCIFIGGKTFVVSYQKDDFFSNDSHNLALYLQDKEVTKKNQLYLVTCISKGLSHKYSWGSSISNAKIKDDKIMLPVKDNKPYFEAMETFISAVQKLVIKDVVQYADKKIEASRKIVSRAPESIYSFGSELDDRQAAETPDKNK